MEDPKIEEATEKIHTLTEARQLILQELRNIEKLLAEARHEKRMLLSPYGS